MLTNKKNNLKKINSMFAAAAAFALLMTGCSLNSEESSSVSWESAESSVSEELETMTSSLADEEQETSSALTASPVVNLVAEEVPYSTDLSSLFTERDLRTDYEITASINLDEVTDSVLNITQEGVYELTGTLKDGQIRINTEGKIQLVLNNANLNCSTGSAIYIENAKKVFLTLAENSENSISDGTGYSDETVSGAAVYSSDSLTINGTGTLTVSGNEDEGILCKDDLVIAGGTITVNSAGNGVKGKDYVAVYDGTLHITAGGDGLKASNSTDAGMGFIYIRNGSFTIDAQEDGIQAETELIIADGTFDVTSGGGTANAEQKHDDFGGFGRGGWDMQTSSETSEEDTVSVKGMKAGTMLYISGGTFTLNTADDALHSNQSLYLTDGSFYIAAGDKGIHADADANFTGGNINITQSYEGIEAADILVSGGTINLKSSDDGFNASDGTEQGAMGQISDCSLTISGGYVYVNADGDGLDSNGSMTISGGTVLVDGPTNDGNGALDSNNGISVTGGFLIAAGSSGMAEYPDDASQNVIVITLDNYQNADTLVTLCDENGDEILSYAPSKQFNSVILSSDALESGKTYQVYLGGSSTASQENGLYETGSYQKNGTESGSVTLEDSVSFIGTAQSMGMGGGMMGGRQGGFPGGQMPDGMELPTDENGEIDRSQMQGGFPGGQMSDGMELPTDENGEIDRSQMQGRFPGGQMPDGMELPTDENGEIDRSQMKGRGMKGGRGENQSSANQTSDFGRDRTQQNG